MGFKVSSTIIVCMVALCLQAGAGHATAAMNGTWVNETLDSGWGAWFSSLAFDNAGNPGISYYSWTQGSLEYANKSGGIWHIDDVEYFAGLYNSLAFDPSGNPAISYMSWVYTPNDLGYAWKSGGTWHYETVDFVGAVAEATSLAFNSTGIPGISYYNSTGRSLKFAWKSNGIWQNESVDSGGGWDSSLAFDPSGNPCISYGTDAGLKVAWKSYDTWAIESVDSGGGQDISLAFDPSGNPCISYINALHYPTYAWKSNGSWHRETIDLAADGGSQTSLAFDWAGNPGVSYWDCDPDAGTMDLKYAHKSGGTWQNGTVDSSLYPSDLGWDHTSVAFDKSGNPRVAYVKITEGMGGYQKYAWYLPPPPTVTSITPASGKRGKRVAISGLNGTGFLPGAKIFLVQGKTKIIGKSVTVVNGTWITCSFKIPATAAIGKWDVKVTNRDGKSGVKKKAFKVKA